MAETNVKIAQVADLVNLAKKTDSLYPRKAAVTAEIEEKISARVSGAYRPAGSIASADELPALSKENLGVVVDINAPFTTTENFREGAGKDYPAGTNVAVVEGETDGSFQYDALSGIVDLTAYAKTETVDTELTKKVDKLEGMGLSSNDYTTAEKTKLASLEIASSAEVQQAIDEALGLTTGGGEEEPVEPVE